MATITARVLILTVSVVLLAGCAADMARTRRDDGSAAYAEAWAWCDGLFADRSIDRLRPQIIINKPATFDMLANEQTPTAEERAAIREYATKAMQCQQRMVEVHRRYATPMHASIYQAASDASNGLTAQLHNGQLTYGRYNRERTKIRNDLRTAFDRINAELGRQNAGARYRAQQLAEQQYQNFLFYQQNLQREQESFQRQFRQRGSVTCNQIGTYTYCNY